MGISLVSFYKEKMKPQWKLAFWWTFFMVLLVHLYKFTNTLPNHDSLYNFYSDQNVVSSGRWFLSAACGVSSFFDLPWVIGILSGIIIALTVVVIVELFQVKNPVLILLIGGLLASFPSITETFFFEYTADGYVLAMLFAALAVFCSGFDRPKVTWSILSAVLVCLSCAIYQAYVSFAMLLTLFYFINELLENRRTNRECWKYILKQVCIYFAGMILYYVIWKICMAVQGIEANHYQGIDQVSNLTSIPFSLSELPRNARKCIKSICLFLEWNVAEYGVTLYGVLNMLLLAAFLIGFLVAVHKSLLFRRKTQLILAVVSLLLCIPCAGMWQFVSPRLEYRPMMLTSLVSIFIYVAILFNRWFKEKTSSIVGLLLAVMIFNNGLMANISYFYMNQEYERSYATGLEMTMQIHEMEREYGFDQIAVVGHKYYEVALDATSEQAKRSPMLLQGVESDLLHDSTRTTLFLQNVFGLDYQFLMGEERETLEAQPEIQEMPQWPDAGCMQIIDRTLIIKIGDTTPW